MSGRFWQSGLAVLCAWMFPVYGNMLTNGDWESGQSLGRDAADGLFWTVPEKARKNATCEIVAEGNNHALHLRAPANPQKGYVLVASRNVPVIAGCRYKLTFRYKSKGLLKPDANFAHGVHAPVDVFIHLYKPDGQGVTRVSPAGRKEKLRVENQVDFADWTEKSLEFTVPALPGKLAVQVRAHLVNGRAEHAAEAWFDNFELLPLDNSLPNQDFAETVRDAAGREIPARWRIFGNGKTAYEPLAGRNGKKAVAVADTPDGGKSLFGWATVLPVRPDREYCFSGWIKGGDLNPNGFIGGGALQIVFLDREGNVLGEPVTSPAVPALTDWKEVGTRFARPPANAFFARCTAGSSYCNGKAWFADLNLQTRVCATEKTVFVRRDPRPAPAVRFAKNLLLNGDLEQGADGRPAHWRYEGKADRDWTEKELTAFHNSGRTPYHVGRGRGAWNRGYAYAGEYSLKNECIAPPLHKEIQWHAYMPVAGRWISDPMDCVPGKMYFAGGWIRPGVNLISLWWGPLYLEFLNADDKVVPPEKPVRASYQIPGGVWSYWTTMPYIAPRTAVKMRLVFGNEVNATTGGTGTSYADNLAVWEAPEGTVFDPGIRDATYHAWFIAAHAALKPPYLPSPAVAPEYSSVWATSVNTVSGNLFADPASPVKQKFLLFNQLGEERTVHLAATRYDAAGAASAAERSRPVTIGGFSQAEVEFAFPPTGGFGAYYVEAKIMEGAAKVGETFGRYAVLPELNRPHTAYNPFAVTTFLWHKDPVAYTPREREIMECVRRAGFGIAWLRVFSNDKKFFAEDYFVKHTAVHLRIIENNARCGMKTVVQVHVPWPTDVPHPRPPLDKEAYFKIGQYYGRVFGGKVAAFGNHGIEQINHAGPDKLSTYRGGWHNYLTDDEYDTMMACVYDGIKSVSPDSVVLTGNIATDFEAKNLKRVSQAPGDGKFDGAVVNCYMGALMVCNNSLKVFDQYGATHKTVWWEESADQRSPFEGPERRYGEIRGAEKLVRTWISMLGKVGPRLKAVTMWGFCPPTPQDIMMMTPNVQPRPQFVAHAVMADFLADATFRHDRSANGIDLYEWTRSDGPVFVAWSETGAKKLTVEAPSGKMTVLDICGNRRAEKVVNGLATLQLDQSPVFIADAGAMTVSRRVTVEVSNSTKTADKPEISVKVANNSGAALNGKLHTRLGDRELSLADKAAETVSFPLPADKLNTARRQTWEAEFTVADGATFAGSAAFVPVFAVRGTPVLDGTWATWEKAPRIKIGENPELNSTVCKHPQENIRDERDLNGCIRMLWDEKNLYLGVEALDDAFVPYDNQKPWRGYMGDSIEFAIQPDALLTLDAPRYEYELFLPLGGATPLLNRRFPEPATVEGWRQVVRPAGKAGDVNYQVAIPWSELRATPACGKHLGLALFLNDKDLPHAVVPYAGQRCWKAFFSGVSSKNPAQYGDVFLTE